MATPHRSAGERERNAERRVQVLELKKNGASMRAIAKALGISVSTAHKHLWVGLEALAGAQEGHAREIRQLMLEQADEAIRGLMPAVRTGDPRAVMALMKVQERAARLQGLDAPTRTALENPDGTPLVPLAALRAMAEAATKPA